MVTIYCSLKHETRDSLCSDCEELMKYARTRLATCPFQEKKTTCAKCPVHCYKPAMRDKVKDVMRFSGPHMTYRHPILALYHFIDKFRKTARNW